MDQTDALLPLEPAYLTVLRISGAILALVQLAVAGLIAWLVPVPDGAVLIPSLALAIWLALVAPRQRYRRWGYAFGDDRLRVVRGFLFHADTVVPLGRIQHIDLHQGPLMRRWGLAELTVHTAGNHGASVSLPGLTLATAETMREAIRRHIREGMA